MPKTSSRFGALPPFPLAEMKIMRSRIEARGVDVIDLGAGDAPGSTLLWLIKHMRS